MNTYRRVGVDRADLTRGTPRLTVGVSGYENSSPGTPPPTNGGTSPDMIGKPVQFRHASDCGVAEGVRKA